jgi:hypothetical protein
VVAHAHDAAALREAMVTALPSGAAKVHWSQTPPKQRQVLVAMIRDLPMSGVVVVRAGHEDEPAERRRRKCFTHFAMEVESRGCTHLTLESRGARADARDRVMLDALRSSRTVSPALRLDHRPGPEDPVLWIADVLCGAVVAARTGRPDHLDALRPVLTVIEVRT